MRRKRFGNSIAVFRLASAQQVRRADNYSRDTESALHAALEHERFTKNVTHTLGKAFDRNDLVPLNVLWFTQTGEHRLAIDQDRAAPARALRGAAVLSRNEAAFLAQDLKEMHALFVVGGHQLPVECERDLRHDSPASQGYQTGNGDSMHRWEFGAVL
jgi:hypothetical protein